MEGRDESTLPETASRGQLHANTSGARFAWKQMNRQSQSSGDNSTQIQAAGDILVGVSESRAREIADTTARSVIAESTEESVQLIQERITKLDDRVIASLIRAGRLEVFSDPGFQRSYKKAQSGAAVSDSENDYDLLAALLKDRAERGPNRKVRAGIERSIEIVDQIDQDALRGLTVLQAIQQFRPLSPTLGPGLDTMGNLFSDLLDGPLPTGTEWLDHLDILDAIRINQVSTLKPFRDYYPTRMLGYLARGAEMDETPWGSDLEGVPSPAGTLTVPHELKPGYERLAVANEETLSHTHSWLPPEARALIIHSATETLGYGDIDATLVDPFLEQLRLRPSLKAIEEWWGQIPQAVQMTGVGRVLARANAHRLDTRNVLPPIE